MKFAIIDIETTGGAPKNNKITEIAIVISDGRQILDQYSSLVNPEMPIPPFITNMTGISNQMVQNAPKFYEIAKEILEFTKDTVFVAHNVKFDYGFIKAEYQQLGFNFTMRQLCTVRLSRACFPKLGSHSLGNLIKHFSLKVKNRHRALDDALATAELFHMMLKDKKTLASVRKTIQMGIKDSSLPEHIPMHTIDRLPHACGIYRFLDKERTPLYIGKSKDIKTRVLQHFKAGSSKSKWLQKRAYDIDFEVTGSELIALLKENDEIKHFRPELNIAQKHIHFPFGIYSYVSSEGYRKFFTGKHPLKSDHSIQLLHLFPTKRAADTHLKTLIEEYELCAKLCGIDRSGMHCFRFDIKACRGACLQIEAPQDYNKRADAALEVLKDYFEENFIVQDVGRHEKEDAFIYIENGLCKGWEYIGSSSSSISENGDSFTQISFPIGANAIIRQYLNKSLTARILPYKTIE